MFTRISLSGYLQKVTTFIFITLVIFINTSQHLPSSSFVSRVVLFIASIYIAFVISESLHSRNKVKLSDSKIKKLEALSNVPDEAISKIGVTMEIYRGLKNRKKTLEKLLKMSDSPRSKVIKKEINTTEKHIETMRKENQIFNL